MAQVPQGQLGLARQQARSGNIPAALTTWRSMFNGNTPPPGLAGEYYMTMASDKALYPQAVSELRQYVAQYPQENAPRVALGKAPDLAGRYPAGRDLNAGIDGQRQ